MAGYENFQLDRNKYGESNQTDIYNPEFANSINVLSEKERLKIEENMKKFYFLASYYR